MNRNLLKTLFFIAFLLIGHISKAQFLERTEVDNAGDTFVNSSMTLEYCICDPIDTLVREPGTGMAITEGFEQAEFDELINNDNQSNVKAFPNPASGRTLNLAFDHVASGIYTVNILNLMGRTVGSQNITYEDSNPTFPNIDISQLAFGVYLIRITNGSDFIRQLKFIKL